MSDNVMYSSNNETAEVHFIDMADSLPIYDQAEDEIKWIKLNDNGWQLSKANADDFRWHLQGAHDEDNEETSVGTRVHEDSARGDHELWRSLVSGSKQLSQCTSCSQFGLPGSQESEHIVRDSGESEVQVSNI